MTRPCQEIKEEDLFAAALALPDSERGAYLKRACATDLALSERVNALIDDFDRAATFIKGAIANVYHDAEQVGPYRLLRELGEGGCGIAYVAQQSAPVKREVAVKVIKPGMDTKAVIARFEAERQALALMDHPNVARVFDAGATAEGRPYFVMELVRGIRITEYCAQSRLTIPERLSLFIQVCQGIQHAHQKGIIHRDIKPSNVLVTMHDSVPLAKVIDFGIAKATQGRLIDQTFHTEIDQIMGTPAYISPEQTEPAQRSVDTRSDIYSLGALLYEILTDHTPFNADRLAQIGIEGMRERLRTEEPLRPSKCLTSLDEEQLARISTSCGTTSVRLVKQIRDDLDWIVMQCLEKEPSRRYQTANELIADLDRYLRNELVSARPPSIAYTVQKLARRNRVTFVFMSTFVLFLAAFAGVMTIQAQRISGERDRVEKERDAAERVSNVMMNVFAIADPFQSLTNGVNGSALLEQAANSIERELHNQPAARARLLQALGRAYNRREQFKPAIGYLEEAVRILSSMPGAESDALIASIDLSMAFRNSGDFRAARETLLRADEIANRFGLERSAAYAKLLVNRGRIALQESQLPAARRDFERSLQLYKTVLGPRSIEVAEVLTDISQALMWSDDLASAERAARQSLEIWEATVPEMYPDRVTAQLALASVLNLQSRFDESASLLEDALRKKTEVFGPNNAGAVNILDTLAMVRYSQRKLDDAEKYSRDAIARCLVVFGERHFATGSFATTLARTLVERGEYREAEATLRESLDIFAATLPGVAPLVWTDFSSG